MKTIEEWRAAKATPEWVFRGLLVSHPAGKALTEDEYDQACADVRNAPVGG